MANKYVMLYNHLILCCPLLLLPSIFPNIRAFSNLEIQLQQQSFQRIFRVYSLQNWLVWSPCSPRDSQDTSPAPQFKRISPLVLSLLYGTILTSVRDYWENHSLDYKDLCNVSNVDLCNVGTQYNAWHIMDDCFKTHPTSLFPSWVCLKHLVWFRIPTFLI